MLDRLPFGELPNVLSDSPYPQYDAATIDHYLRQDSLLSDQQVLLYDGVPVFSPSQCRGNYHMSWYWDSLMVTPYLPVAYEQLPELWETASKLSTAPLMMSGGVIATGQVDSVKDYAWLATEHIILPDNGLTTYNAKRRYKLRQGQQHWGPKTRVSVVDAHFEIEAIFRQVFAEQAVYWKRHAANVFEYEFALRQWVWARSVCLNHLGYLVQVVDAHTGDLLAVLAFYDQVTHLVFGAFCQMTSQQSDLSGIGSFSLYAAATRLQATNLKPIFLGTSAAELDGEDYLVYKLNVSNGSIPVPCFATRGASCAQPLQPPLFDTRMNIWVQS